MSLSAAQADLVLVVLTNSFVVLHTGAPGAAGTANVALDDADAPMAPKAASFAAAENHPSNTERRRLSNAEIAFTGTELKAGQTVTHASLWDGATGPGTDGPIAITALTEPKMTGSDGATIASGDLEVAIGVFAKP